MDIRVVAACGCRTIEAEEREISTYCPAYLHFAAARICLGGHPGTEGSSIFGFLRILWKI